MTDQIQDEMHGIPMEAKQEPVTVDISAVCEISVNYGGPKTDTYLGEIMSSEPIASGKYILSNPDTHTCVENGAMAKGEGMSFDWATCTKCKYRGYIDSSVHLCIPCELHYARQMIERLDAPYGEYTLCPATHTCVEKGDLERLRKCEAALRMRSPNCMCKRCGNDRRLPDSEIGSDIYMSWLCWDCFEAESGAADE